MKRYPLAPNGIFATIQGEGHLLGRPTTFIRLAGCSVGCAGCDTDYSVAERCTADKICDRVKQIHQNTYRMDRHIWITGGEPTDHDLKDLLHTLQFCGGLSLATSGIRDINDIRPYFDFVSVSPHKTPQELKVVKAEQINLVPGLNGLRLSNWRHFDFSGFVYRYVTPSSLGQIDECIDFVKSHDGFNLGIQAHKVWGVA